MSPSPRLFRSRWKALIWAGGIVWFAVDIASSAPHRHEPANATAPAANDALGDEVNQADLAAIVNGFGE